jgi:hypothetical protein
MRGLARDHAGYVPNFRPPNLSAQAGRVGLAVLRTAAAFDLSIS